MNIKRALGFGVMMWILIFVAVSIIMFLPFLEGREVLPYLIYWVVLVPMVLFSAKWYFRVDPPTLKKGFFLGVIGVLVGTVLDLIITIPLFIAQDISYAEGLKEFYGIWPFWVSLAWFILLCAYAGWEFDGTFSKKGK